MINSKLDIEKERKFIIQTRTNKSRLPYNQDFNKSNNHHVGDVYERKLINAHNYEHNKKDESRNDHNQKVRNQLIANILKTNNEKEKDSKARQICTQRERHQEINRERELLNQIYEKQIVVKSLIKYKKNGDNFNREDLYKDYSSESKLDNDKLNEMIQDKIQKILSEKLNKGKLKENLDRSSEGIDYAYKEAYASYITDPSNM